MSALLTTSQAASQLHISVDTLRRYEEQGRISSQRTAGGHRRFTQTDVNSLGRALGLNTTSPLEDYVHSLENAPIPEEPVAFEVTARTCLTWAADGTAAFDHQIYLRPITAERCNFTSAEASELAQTGRTRNYKDEFDFFGCSVEVLTGLKLTAEKSATFATEELCTQWAAKKHAEYEDHLRKVKPRMGVVNLENTEELNCLVFSQGKVFDNMDRVAAKLA